MIKAVYATETVRITTESGAPVLVQKGSHWPADDPIVRDNPQLFSEDPRWGMVYTRPPEGYDAPIEQATAAPGEKRNTRRG